MKILQVTAWIISIILLSSVPTFAQQINDSNTPLHLMQPQYLSPYGVSTQQAIKQKMDLVLHYLEQSTPCILEDKESGKEVNPEDIGPNTQLRRGDFRLTSYEWGVTYSGVLAAYKVTGDNAYRDYVYKRHKLLSDMAPYFQKAGLSAQNTYATFNEDGTFSAAIAGKKFSGTWTLDEQNAKVTMKTLLLTINCYAKRESGGISLLFESKKLLNVLQVLASMSGNDTAQKIGELSKNYDGVRLGFDMKK